MSGRNSVFLLILLGICWSCSRQDEATLSPTWTVIETGFGPLQIGMTVDEARKALGSPFEGGESSESCYFIRPENKPDDIVFMIVNGRIARLDVTGDSIPTAVGVRVGDTEARVQMLYAGRVANLPHKYIEGHYLIVGSDSETGRIIFETDGEKVIRYRAGKPPEVDWVEGCS